MKRFLSLLFVAISYFASAQNYQCLQSGVKHFFINGNNYLRAIRIDSTRTAGDTTIYYPFHTPRGAYNTSMAVGNPTLDTNGGSWLGKRVLQLSDGTFIFDSYWNDSVVIKTQANVGDSWVFYHDSSNIYYKATVVSMDTMSFLSAFDSVKNVMINAYDSTGLVPSDPLDSFTFILSKNHGFVQVFDLYTFPYHKMDSAYRLGLDFFLDKSMCDYNYVNGNPNPPYLTAAATIFSLTDFIIPNDQQLHNWGVGDILESVLVEGGVPTLSAPCYSENIGDTVVGITVAGHTKNYTLIGTPVVCTSCIGGIYPCPSINDTGTFSFSDIVYPIADTSYMPEHFLPSPSRSGSYIFYFPDDSQFCLHSPFYRLLPIAYFTAGLGGGASEEDYKMEIGETYLYYFDGNPTFASIQLTEASGVGCGALAEVNNVYLNPGDVQLFPNPATTQVTIASKMKMSRVYFINVLGQCVFSSEGNSEKIQIDISGWANGVYFVRVNSSAGSGQVEVRRFVKE